MKQVLYDKNGKVFIEDVPVPHCGKDQVLVRVEFSLVSAGTELSMIGLMKKPLVQMALERRDLAKQVIDYAKEAGIKSTIDLMRSRLDVWHELGYSCAGKVEVAGENSGFKRGDRVACLGSGFANHAEYVAVPKTLVARLPKGVGTRQGAWGGIGAIAMQSIRQLAPTIGETHVVIGLGLIGDLVAQILKANGCKVVGIDIDESKTHAPYIDYPLSHPDPKAVQRITGGADGVIIAASSKDNLTNIAFDMCRRKGRVVMLGVTGMDIDRSRMYEKELELRMSTSFGAGYYDPEYDIKGRDYPISHVRWTAGRNMQAFVGLVADKKIILPEGKLYPVEKAVDAYNSRDSPIMLSYCPDPGSNVTIVQVNANIRRARVNVGLIGAGNFTRGFIIPNLKRHKDYRIYAVCTRDGSKAKHIAEQEQAKYATTDYQRILDDRNIDLIIIGTRHDTHAEIALAAIKAKKHIFVEKPIAIYEEELVRLESALRGYNRIFAAGFNRRYAPLVVKLKDMLGKRNTPIMVNYIFNNQELHKDHWVNQRDVGGGRFLGEACHIMDLFNFLAGCKPVCIKSQGVSSEGILPDNNIVVAVSYEDGSVCNLLYTCMGNASVEKERMEVFDGGNVYVLSNFQSLLKNGVRKYSSSKDEGHSAEFTELMKALKGKPSSLITAEESLLAQRMTFDALRLR